MIAKKSILDLDYKTAMDAADRFEAHITGRDYTALVADLNVLATAMGLPPRENWVITDVLTDAALRDVKHIQHVFQDMCYTPPEGAGARYREFIVYLNLLMSNVESNYPAKSA